MPDLESISSVFSCDRLLRGSFSFGCLEKHYAMLFALKFFSFQFETLALDAEISFQNLFGAQESCFCHLPSCGSSQISATMREAVKSCRVGKTNLRSLKSLLGCQFFGPFQNPIL